MTSNDSFVSYYCTSWINGGFSVQWEVMCCFRHVGGGSMLQYWAGVDVDIRCHRCSCAASCWRHNEPDKIGVGTDITDNFLDLFSIFWLFQDVSGPENSVPSIPRRSRKVKQFIPQADAFFHRAPISGYTSSRYTVTRCSNAMFNAEHASMRTLAVSLHVSSHVSSHLSPWLNIVVNHHN